MIQEEDLACMTQDQPSVRLEMDQNTLVKASISSWKPKTTVCMVAILEKPNPQLQMTCPTYVYLPETSF